MIKDAAAVLTPETLDRFRASLEIVKTDKDRNGGSYNTYGTLNQAAWIGENVGCLIRELERLRPDLKMKPPTKPMIK